MDVEPDTAGFRQKLQADLAGQAPVEVPIQADVGDFLARLEAALATGRLAALGGVNIPVHFEDIGRTLGDIGEELTTQTDLLDNIAISSHEIMRNTADTSLDLMAQTQLLGEIRDLFAGVALASAATGRNTRDMAGATAAAGAAGLLAGTRFGGWLAALGGITGALSVAHLGLVLFSAQVAADTIGIVAFGAEASHAIGPAVAAVGHLTTAYSALNPFQKAAALSLQSFTDGLRTADQAGIFGVFYQGLSLVQQSMSHAGGITTQATKAFSDFAGMLAADFGSPAWAAVFGHGTTIIRTDLDALFRLINSGINLIPVLFHNFNSLGLAVINAATDVLGFTRAVLGFNPELTKFVAGATAAYAAYKLLWVGLGPGPGILQGIATGLRNVAISATAFIANTRAEGLVAAFAYAGVSDLALGLGALLLPLGAAAIAGALLTDKISGALQAFQAQAQSLQNNAAGYRALADQVASFGAVTAKTASDVRSLAGGVAFNQVQGGLTRMAQGFDQAATNITQNARNIGSALDLTNRQVIDFANKTGVNLTHALAVGGAAFTADVSKIAGYANAITLSHNPLSQFQVDVNQSRSAANSLTQQVQALQASFQALITPTLNVIQGSITLRQNEQTLRQALIASSGEIGNQNKLAQTAGLDLVTAANAALTNSANIKQMTGSTRAAAAPLQSLVALMDAMHVHGLLAVQVLHEIKAAEDALHDKTITITINTVGAVLGGQFGRPQPGQVGYTPAGGGIIPGYAPGHDTVPLMASPGEAIMVPEWVRAVGPEQIMAWNRAFGGGRRSSPELMAGGGIAMSHQFRFPQDIFNINIRADTAIGGGGPVFGPRGPLPGGSGGPAIPQGAEQLAQRTAQAMRQYASSITSNLASSYSSLSAIASGAPVNAAGQPVPPTGQFLKTQLAAKLATLKQFFNVIRKLRNDGVDKSLIAQVVSLGPDQGLQYADAILAGGDALIRQLNTEEAGIGRYEKLIGQRSAEIQYGQPIAKGFAFALKSAEVEAELRRFGRKVAIEIARELGIPLSAIPGLERHRRPDDDDLHRHHRPGGGGGPGAVTINFYGTERPSREEMAAIKREMGLALGGSW